MLKCKLKIAVYLLCLIVFNYGTLILCQEDEKEEEAAETASIYNGCNQTIHEGQGIILSPGFPSPYSDNIFCTWNIEVEPTRTVLISFRVFDVESSSSCMYDKVKIYNGPTTNHMLLGKHCGVFRPGDTVGTSNRMLMTFETDGNNVHPKSGFYAVFVSVPQRLAVPGSCGGVLREPKGEFHSLNFPKANYPNQVTCTWYIRADADKVIILSFQKFTLEVS
jgi:cubilin